MMDIGGFFHNILRSWDVADAIRGGDYEAIVYRLRNGGMSSCRAAEFGGGCEMTGLEYAVRKKRWKMVAIFFAFGADPKDNIFNGIDYNIWNNIHPRFEEGVVVPGFDGLDLLVDDDDDIGRAYLWFFRRLYGRQEEISIIFDFREFMDRLDMISDDLHFTGEDCRDYVLNTLMCMRHLGVPNDIAMRIAEESLSGKIRHQLDDFAMRGVGDGINEEGRGIVRMLLVIFMVMGVSTSETF